MLGELDQFVRTHTEELAKAEGPLFALNPDHWQATPQQLETPPAGPNK